MFIPGNRITKEINLVQKYLDTDYIEVNKFIEMFNSIDNIQNNIFVLLNINKYINNIEDNLNNYVE